MGFVTIRHIATGQIILQVGSEEQPGWQEPHVNDPLTLDGLPPETPSETR